MSKNNQKLAENLALMGATNSAKDDTFKSLVRQGAQEDIILHESQPVSIWYRSCEKYNAQTKILTSQMIKEVVNDTNNIEIISNNLDRKSPEYNQSIIKVLQQDIKSIPPEKKPDIIVLGEFSPFKDGHNKDVFLEGYTIKDNVKLEGREALDGGRAMTIAVKDNSKGWHRITVHDIKPSEDSKEQELPMDIYNTSATEYVDSHKNKEIFHENDDFKTKFVKARLYEELCAKAKEEMDHDPKENKRDALNKYTDKVKSIETDLKKKDSEYVKKYNKSRDDTKNLLTQCIGKEGKGLGQFIELMYYNHIIYFVHVKGCGTTAKKNIISAIEQIKTIVNTPIVFMGDTNVGATKESPTIHTGGTSNENYQGSFQSGSGSVKALLPLEQNLFPGVLKTAVGAKKAHDGRIYSEAVKEAHEYLGSRWGITLQEDGKYMVSSDHKAVGNIFNPDNVPLLRSSTIDNMEENVKSQPQQDNLSIKAVSKEEELIEDVSQKIKIGTTKALLRSSAKKIWDYKIKMMIIIEIQVLVKVGQQLRVLNAGNWKN